MRAEYRRASLIFILSIAVGFTLYPWLTQDIKKEAGPLYIQLVPIFTAMVGGAFAWISAEKVYKAALKTDERERGFRKEDFELKRKAFCGLLFFEPEVIKSMLDAHEYRINTTKNALNEKKYSLLNISIDADSFFDFSTDMIDSDLKTLSDLEHWVMNDLLDIKFKLKYMRRIVTHLPKVMEAITVKSSKFQNIDHDLRFFTRSLDTLNTQRKKASELSDKLIKAIKDNYNFQVN